MFLKMGHGTIISIQFCEKNMPKNNRTIKALVGPKLWSLVNRDILEANAPRFLAAVLLFPDFAEGVVPCVLDGDIFRATEATLVFLAEDSEAVGEPERLACSRLF